jgi:hypothetical protein
MKEFHAVADLFPLMRGAAFEELAADIKKNGLREPILVDGDGRILDGRNRYRACLAAGVEPRFVEWQGEEPVAELALSLNLRRRHLNQSQRAMVAARLAKMMETEAIKRKGRRTDLAAELQPGRRRRSSSEAAAMINVSPRLVHYGISVLQHGCEELIAAVESGELGLTPASGLARLPKEEQAKAIAGGARQAAAKIRQMRAAKTRFGVRRVATPGAEEVTFLWVPAGALVDAIETLKRGGFECVGLS